MRAVFYQFSDVQDPILLQEYSTESLYAMRLAGLLFQIIEDYGTR